MDSEEKAQFILNLAKELVVSGKYPMPKKEIIIKSIALIPRIDTKYEPLPERQQAFTSGFINLVKSLSDLYDSLQGRK